MSARAFVQALGERRYVRAPVPLFFPSSEEMPETGVHLRLRTALFLVIERAVRGRAFVGSEQFVYWDATNPKACLSPDVMVRLGGPVEPLPSYKVWEHGAPHLAVEVVSASDARDRDWAKKLERYRRCAVGELVRFDPEDADAPLRLWDFIEGDLVERDRTDPEGFRCDALSAYWHVTPDRELGRALRLARDREGRDLWLTPEEDLTRERAERDTERDAALARVAELERELSRRR